MKRFLVFLACVAGIAPTLADEAIKDGAKKAEKGMGQLLQGIGQEIRKATDSVSKAAKKDGKPAEKVKEERK